MWIAAAASAYHTTLSPSARQSLIVFAYRNCHCYLAGLKHNCWHHQRPPSLAENVHSLCKCRQQADAMLRSLPLLIQHSCFVRSAAVVNSRRHLRRPRVVGVAIGSAGAGAPGRGSGTRRQRGRSGRRSSGGSTAAGVVAASVRKRARMQSAVQQFSGLRD